MSNFPTSCPICGNEKMYLQFLDTDDSEEIKAVGSACGHCLKVWVQHDAKVKNHPHYEDIIFLEKTP